MDEETGLVRSSVAYPFAGPARAARLLFGAGLHFFGVVVSVGAVAAAARTVADSPLLAAAGIAVGTLAVLPVFGYAAATMRAILDDEAEPPTFDDWGALFRDGRRVALVSLLYAIPLAALGAPAFAFDPGGSAVATQSAALLAAAGLYLLVAGYVLPAALVTVVDEGEASAAWNVARLREAVVDRRYLAAWLVGATIALVGGALGTVLVPFVVGFAVLFATQLAATHAVTRGVVASLDLVLGQPPPPPASGYVPGWDDGPRRKKLSDGRLGGALLPTTPDEDGDAGDIDPDEAPSSPGPLATTGGGDDGSTDLDRPGDAPSTDDGDSTDDEGSSGGTAAGSADEQGSDIAPFVAGDDDLDTTDGEDG